MIRALPSGVRSALCRATALVMLAVAPLVLAADPAAAHGGGDLADGSNYASRITGVVEAATGASADAGDLRWRVLANDALLELRNGGAADVVVSGYEGEPYLRIGPEGVFENVASPASVLNDDRYGLGNIPPEVSASADPRWERRSSDPEWRWHDHRIHWMATTAPPQVKVDPEATVEVLVWQVPYTAGRQQLALAGALWWVPRPPPWPWLAAAALGLVVPLGLASRPAGRTAGVGRPGAVLGAAAGLSALVGLLTVVRAVDDIVSFPASAGADAVVFARACLLALPALAAVAWVRRAGTGGALAVAAGAAILALGNAPAALAVLSMSQVASAAPAAARLVAALVVMLVLLMAVALVVALATRGATDRRHPDRPRRPREDPAPVPSDAPAPGMLVPRPRQ